MVIHRVRLEKKNLQKSTLAFNGGWNSENHQFLVINWVSSCLSFFPERLSTAATYIFTAARNCTTTIISLEYCALNAECQHDIWTNWLIKYCRRFRNKHFTGLRFCNLWQSLMQSMFGLYFLGKNPPKKITTWCPQARTT